MSTPTPDPDPNKPEDPEDGLGTGAIIGIAAVAGVGGFSLFWFAIKKKSLADLLAVFKKS